MRYLLVLFTLTASCLAQSGGLVNATRGFPQPNASTGTTLNSTATINASGQAVLAAASTTAPVWIVVGGAGTSGNATLASNGSLALCTMDATLASAGNAYVIASATAGRCHPQTAQPAAGTWVIGFIHDASTTSGSTALVAVNGFFVGGSGTGSGLTGVTTGGGLAVSGSNVGLITCTANQYLTWNSNAWGCTPAPTGGGTVTGATSGGGLLLSGATLGLITCTANQILQWNSTWGCANPPSGSGGITGAATGGGLVVNGSNLGMLTSCANNEYLSWSTASAAWQCTPAPTAGGVNGTINSGTTAQFAYYTGPTTISSSASLDEGLVNPGALTLREPLMSAGATLPTKSSNSYAGIGFENGLVKITYTGVGAWYTIPIVQIGGSSSNTNALNFLNTGVSGTPANAMPVTFTRSGATASASVVGTGNAGDCLVGTGVFQTCPGGTSGSTAISGLTAATGPNTISNGDNKQTWQWNLTSANTGLEITESAPSTAAGSSLVKISQPTAGTQAVALTVQSGSQAGGIPAVVIQNNAGAVSTTLGVSGGVATVGSYGGYATSGVPSYCGGTCSGAVNGIVGGAHFRGSDNSAANAGATSGFASLHAGTLTAASPVAGQVHGFTQVSSPFFCTGTCTLGTIMCATGTVDQVNACATTPQSAVLGIAAATTATSTQVVTAGAAQVNLDNAGVVGHTVCTSTTTAGSGTDSGGTAACATGHQIGVVMAISGTIAVPGTNNGTQNVTLTASAPKVALADLGSSGTVRSGTQGQFGWYSATGAAISGSPALSDNGTTLNATEGLSILSGNASQISFAGPYPSALPAQGTGTAQLIVQGTTGTGSLYFANGGGTGVSGAFRAVQTAPLVNTTQMNPMVQTFSGTAPNTCQTTNQPANSRCVVFWTAGPNTGQISAGIVGDGNPLNCLVGDGSFSPCPSGTGGSGSGTVSSGTAGQVAYYSASGTAVSGSNQLTIGSTSVSSTLPIAIASTTLTPVASTNLFGASSGAPMWSNAGATFQPFVLGPATACTANQVLRWVSPNWTCYTPTSGTVTGPTANGGLTGTTTLGLVTSGCTNGMVMQYNGTAWNCATPATSAATSMTCQPSADLFAFTTTTNWCVLTFPNVGAIKQYLINCNVIWNRQTTGQTGTTNMTSNLVLSVAPAAASYFTTETWASAPPPGFGNVNVLTSPLTTLFNTTASAQGDTTIWSWVYHGALMVPATGITATFTVASSNGTGLIRLGSFCIAQPTNP